MRAGLGRGAWGRRRWTVVRTGVAAATLVVAATVPVIALSSTAVASPVPIGATLTVISGTQSQAHASLTCDSATSMFSVTISGIEPGWLQTDQAWMTVGAASPVLLGDTIPNDGSVHTFNAVSVPGECVVGEPVAIFGPGAAPPYTLDMTGTLHSLDITPPVITVPADQTVEAAGPSGVHVRYPTATAVDDLDGARPVMCTPPSGSEFPLGSTTVTCTASDTSGNIGSSTFIVRVVDTKPPELTVPGDMVVHASTLGALGSSTWPVHYAVTASDNASGVASTSCNPPSGSAFAYGVTTVTCTATDHSGNTATRSFTVDVHPPGSTDITTSFVAPTTGVVHGVVALAPLSRISDELPPVHLDGTVAVFACDPSITTLDAVTTTARGARRAPCVAGDSNGDGFAYSIADLAPGSYNLFATASSIAGDLVAERVPVTITAGGIVARNLLVRVPADRAAVVGQVTIERIPAATNFQLTTIYACIDAVSFASDGTPSAGGNCVQGHIDPGAEVLTSEVCTAGPLRCPAEPTKRGTAPFGIGSLPGGSIEHLYAVYRSDAFGVGVTRTVDTVAVSAGLVATAPELVAPFRAPQQGAVHGVLDLAPSGALPTGGIGDRGAVYVCVPQVMTYTEARTANTSRCMHSAMGDERTYFIGSLPPHAYNAFASLSTSVGDFTSATPVKVTITAGQIVSADLTVTPPANGAGLTGRVTITNVPNDQGVTFTHVYACNRPTPFTRDGVPQATVGASGPCVEGQLGHDVAEVPTGSTASYSVPYYLGPLLGAHQQISVVYSTELGTFVTHAQPVASPSGEVTTVAPIVQPFPTAIPTGAVQGTAVITGAPLGRGGLTIERGDLEVQAFACPPDVTRFSDIRTGRTSSATTGAACVQNVASIDRHGVFAVGGLAPGSYHVFARVPTLVGSFLNSTPVPVTVTAGHVTMQDVAVTYDPSSGAVFGTTTIGGVPLDTGLEFLSAYACRAATTFASVGTPRAPCVPGQIASEDSARPVATGPSSASFSTTYEFGPLRPGEWHLYVQYRTAFGVMETPDSVVTAAAGKVGAA